MIYKGLSNHTYVLILILAAALMAGAGLVSPHIPSTVDSGICLPSPNLWQIPPVWSYIINGVLIIGLSLWTWFLNKGYNFVKNSGFTVPALMAIFTAGNPLVSGSLDTSSLMLIFWLLCLSVLFGCYRGRNSTQELFLVATFLSIGSMSDYAFLVVAPMVILAAILLKILHLRELLAFLMGLVAPYWIAVGFGLLRLEDFHMPQFTNFTNGPLLPADMLTMGVGLGILVVCAGMGALNTAVKLYAGNPQTRTYNYVVYLLGIYCILCMILDSGNLLSYVTTLYFCIAVMFGNLFALNNVGNPPFWVWILTLLSVIYWALLVF